MRLIRKVKKLVPYEPWSNCSSNCRRRVTTRHIAVTRQKARRQKALRVLNICRFATNIAMLQHVQALRRTRRPKTATSALSIVKTLQTKKIQNISRVLRFRSFHSTVTKQWQVQVMLQTVTNQVIGRDWPSAAKQKHWFEIETTENAKLELNYKEEQWQ